VPSDFHSIDDDDLSDEEVYTIAPGEPESSGTVTLPNATVIGPNEVDADGTRHPAPERLESAERPAWTGYVPRIDPPK
jgi:hypothetical protein